MASILYLSSENGMEERFSALLSMANRKKRFKVYHSLSDLSEILRKPHSNIRVAVIFAANEAELTGIISLGSLMADVKIILILADEGKDTMLKAHMLRPRYITWLDSGLGDMLPVLKRMIDLYDVSVKRKRPAVRDRGAEIRGRRSEVEGQLTSDH